MWNLQPSKYVIVHLGYKLNFKIQNITESAYA